MVTRKRHLWIPVSMIAVGLVGLLGLSLNRAFDKPWFVPGGTHGGYGPRMGPYDGNGLGWPGMMGAWDPGNVQSLSSVDATHAMESSLANAIVDKVNNRVTYRGQSIRLVVLGGAMDGTSAGPAEKFVVAGLVNPTLNVPKGSRITLELINEDTDMPHGIEVSAIGPPYATMSMMQGGVYSGSFIAPMNEASSGEFPMASTTFTADKSGTFYYLCQYPGHAAEGMYGKLVVS